MIPTTRIYCGDALTRLREMPDQSVHMVMTSPPYWALRSYEGGEGMIGLETTWTEHVFRLLAVFAEVRRVLRDDGTLWLNYGDAYAHRGKSGGATPRGPDKGRADTAAAQGGIDRAKGIGLRPKNLMQMPARLAIAMQEHGGWILRDEIVWAKPNPVPSSAIDRPTSAHEKVFLFSKRGRYFYDADAVRTPQTADSVARLGRARHGIAEVPPGMPPHTGTVGPREKLDEPPTENEVAGANLRNVWSIPVYPYPEAHHATFPPRLVVPCVLAGTSAHGVCGNCGAPWARITEEFYENPRNRQTNGPRSIERPNMPYGGAGFPVRLEKRTETIGWEPTCGCDTAQRVPATVLDPFGGAGTVGMVANELGRSAVLIEIGPQSVELARSRIVERLVMFADVEVIE